MPKDIEKTYQFLLRKLLIVSPIFFALLLCYTSIVFAENSGEDDGLKPLLIGADSIAPPYVFTSAGHKHVSGLDIYVLNLIFAEMGYKIEFRSVTSRRLPRFLKQADAVMAYDKSRFVNTYFSRPYRLWLNALFVVENTELADIETIETFLFAQNALAGDPGPFIDQLSSMPQRQNNQATLNSLLRGRMDAYIGDAVSIWYFYRGLTPADRVPPLKALHYYQPSPQYLAFKDQNLCKDFDEALTRLLKSDDYYELYSTYTGSRELSDKIRAGKIETLAQGCE